MTTPSDLDRLDRLRRDSPHCLGVAWFTGAPLELAAASGEPAGDAWPSWHTIARLASSVLRDGPIASPEVLFQLPDAVVLVAERAAGVVAVAVAVTPAGPGVALVQARIAASQVPP
jgi:glucose/arabinose dehydrogenase